MNLRSLSLAVMLFALLATSAHAVGMDRHDIRVNQVVTRGLDWIASTQSRLGHWNAAEGRYPTAMTALAASAELAVMATKWLAGSACCSLQRRKKDAVKTRHFSPEPNEVLSDV